MIQNLATQEQLNDINENLTKCLTYNEDDDYIYINGVKWKLAGLYTIALIPKMTSATCSVGSVSATSTLSDGYGTHSPYLAFNGDITESSINSWLGGRNSQAQGLTFTFNSTQRVSQVELIVSNAPGLSCISTTIDIFYSNDTTTNGLLGSVSIDATTAKRKIYIDLDEIVNVKSITYKPRTYTSTDGGSTFCELAYMQVYGAK